MVKGVEMPITVHWDDSAQTVVRWDLTGRWTWQEFAAAQEESDAMVISVAHLVDVIANLEQSPTLPENPLSHYRQAVARKPENRGLVVFAGAGTFVQAMGQIFNRVFGERIQDEIVFVATVEEARRFLDERRAG